MQHGDGIPLLFDYQDRAARFCFVGMKSDISRSRQFSGLLEENVWYDVETPYGYGGPLSDESVPEDSQRKFREELINYCAAEHIVSLFIRFHPLLRNWELLPEVFETRYLRDTIFMDTSSREIINGNMDAKNRNMIRKAMKSGVSVICKPVDTYEDFALMYRETMDKDQADLYYLFDKKYFEAQKKLSENARYFYAMLDGKTIAGTLIYFNDRFAHYHLAGTRTAFRPYAPGNLLLFSVAGWAAERGIAKFHLGGGMSPEDPLFAFKKKFNKNGRLPFLIGRWIANREAYAFLMKLRKESSPDFNENNSRMIQYRCE